MFLVEDGIVGSKTWRALYKGTPIDMPVLSNGSTGKLVKQMQKRIAADGYCIGAIDGIFGPETEFAVKNLQQDTGLPIDGIVGDRTWLEISKINNIFY